MPNNPARHRRGFEKVPSGTLRARKRDVITSMRVTNRAFVTASQETGSPNGGPAPTYAGGTGTGGDFGGLGGSGSNVIA